jgi:hypothetical protein
LCLAYGLELYAAAQKPEGQITEVSYMFPRPGADAKPVPKVSWQESVSENPSLFTRPLLNNRHGTIGSVVILHRNILASVVRHEPRRRKAYCRASGDVDGNRVTGLIGGEQGCRDKRRRTAGNHRRELVAQ